MLAKFHENTHNLSENIAKSFRGATFLTHTVEWIRLWESYRARAKLSARDRTKIEHGNEKALNQD